VLAGKEFGIPVMGTMAHSWVMAHCSEEEAFQAYSDIYPDRPVFLIDTYDTLKSGAPKAIKVGLGLAAQGRNFGVRLDSGDIHYLAVEVRKMLDDAGLPQASISVSNDLDETIIQALTEGGAPVNSWGVGTRMVTGGTDAAFTGVYKLTSREDGEGIMTPTMKCSDHPDKTTNPGIKQVWRIRDAGGLTVADVLSLEDPDNPDLLEPGRAYTFWHPAADYRHFQHYLEAEPELLLKRWMDRGKLIRGIPALSESRAWVRTGLDQFDPSYKRFLNPHIYKVSITERLRNLKLQLIKNYLGLL
jgi:nicotinate phosphoribosyltransferase